MLLKKIDRCQSYLFQIFRIQQNVGKTHKSWFCYLRKCQNHKQQNQLNLKDEQKRTLFRIG